MGPALVCRPRTYSCDHRPRFARSQPRMSSRAARGCASAPDRPATPLPRSTGWRTCSPPAPLSLSPARRPVRIPLGCSAAPSLI